MSVSLTISFMTVLAVLALNAQCSLACTSQDWFGAAYRGDEDLASKCLARMLNYLPPHICIHVLVSFKRSQTEHELIPFLTVISLLPQREFRLRPVMRLSALPLSVRSTTTSLPSSSFSKPKPLLLILAQLVEPATLL
jgi:hypothetical protein